jgi:hypothetical protein
LSSFIAAALAFSAAVVLASCASYDPRNLGRANGHEFPEVPAAQISGEALMTYAASLQLLNRAELNGECFRLERKYRASKSVPLLFQLFVAQATASGCGDLRATARFVRAFQGRVTDPTLARFLGYQQVLASKLLDDEAERDALQSALDRSRANLRQALSKHRQSVTQVRLTYRQMRSRDAEARHLKQKVDELKSVEQGLSQSVRSRDAEARLLKQKLDALKSIEQEINESEKREDHE